MNRAVFVLITGLVMAAACDSKTPTQPPAAATLQSVAVLGVPSTLYVDEQVQLSARATYSDGRTEAVTSSARWATRTFACVVDSSGLLSGTGEGDCTVEASLNGVTATASASVGAARFFTVTGRVREQYGDGHPAMPNVRVVIATGTQAGRQAATDAEGRFTFTEVPREEAQIRAEPAGYAPMTGSMAPGGAPLDFLISPEIVVDRRAFPNDDDLDWSYVSIPVTITHRGPLVLKTRSNRRECEISYRDIYVTILLDANGRRLTSLTPCDPGVWQAYQEILKPGQYMIRVSYLNGTCYCNGGNTPVIPRRELFLSYPR